MDLRRQADSLRAMRQWEALRETLVERCGARVEMVRAHRDLPDMCFAANAGLVRGRTFIPARFRHPERAGEEPRFTAWFRRRGYRIRPLPEGECFEGEGDGLFAGNRLFLGYFERTDLVTHQRIGEMLGARAVSLELVDPRFYHLDTCFAPFGPNSALYYPGAFTLYGRKVLTANLPDLVPVSEADARHFGCNAICIGRNVILCAPARQLARTLEKRGFHVFPLDFSEFIKAGGAAKCLVLRLES